MKEEIARLNDEGYADRLLREVWSEYPAEARDAELPELSTPEPQTISNRQAAELLADLTGIKPDPARIRKEIREG